MAKKTAKKPLTVKPRKTGADGVVLPGEKAAKVATPDEKSRLLDTIVRSAYALEGRIGTARLAAGSIVSIGIFVGEGGAMRVKAHVVEPASGAKQSREYEVNA